jgi:lambda repressor-like predicted transcriptional regulator
MPAIKPHTRRVKEALQSCGMTFQELAKSIGRSPGTITNVLTGNAKSRPVQQLITDFFGFQIWPEVEPSPSMIRIILPPGTALTLAQPEYAAGIAGYFGAKSASPSGKIIFPRTVYCHLAQRRRPIARKITKQPPCS